MGRDYFSGKYRLEDGGYALRRGFFFRHPVPLNTFRNDPCDPLTFHTAEGDTIQPFRTFDAYDQGSSPLILQGVVSANFGQKTTIFHDSTFHFKAWWFNGAMVRVTMWRANNMMYRMARAEFEAACEAAGVAPATTLGALSKWWNDKGNRISNGWAWLGVMLGGWFTWRKTDAITAANRRRVDNVEAALAGGLPEPGEMPGNDARPQ